MRLIVQYRIYNTHQIDSFITIECENDNISITNSYIDYKFSKFLLTISKPNPINCEEFGLLFSDFLYMNCEQTNLITVSKYYNIFCIYFSFYGFIIEYKYIDE